MPFLLDSLDEQDAVQMGNPFDSGRYVFPAILDRRAINAVTGFSTLRKYDESVLKPCSLGLIVAVSERRLRRSVLENSQSSSSCHVRLELRSILRNCKSRTLGRNTTVVNVGTSQFWVSTDECGARHGIFERSVPGIGALGSDSTHRSFVTTVCDRGR